MRWSEVKRPIVCLAPMDGVTNTAYRQIVRKLNPEVILFSEFTSVDGLVRSLNVRRRLEFDPSEHPFFMQLFGNNPKVFADAAKMVEDRGIMGVDINMGCPSKKIVHSQHGSALMKDPGTACRIIEKIRNACGLEVSVKTRLGWENYSGLIDFCSALESAGVSMITIHGRTYSQAFKGDADWGPIYQLKKELKIPVLGNGDVRDFQDGMDRLGNLDGFMIGRHAIGNPWCFQDRLKVPQPSLADRITMALEHYCLLCSLKPERIAVMEFRKYLGHYLSGFHNARDWRARMMECNTGQEFVARMNQLREQIDPMPIAG